MLVDVFDYKTSCCPGHSGTISPSVLTIFEDLSKSTAFLSKIDDHTTSALLGLLDGFFDPKNQIWTTCADVGAKDVRAVTFVMP